MPSFLNRPLSGWLARRGDLLFFVDSVEGKVDFHVDLFFGPFGFDGQFRRQPADDVVVADVDVDVRALERLFHFGLASSSCASGSGPALSSEELQAGFSASLRIWSIAPATLRSPLTLVVSVPPTSAPPSLVRLSTKSSTLSPAAACWQAVLASVGVRRFRRPG